MGGNNLKWFIIVSSCASIAVSLKVGCKFDEEDKSSLTCQCFTTNNVAWYKNGRLISTCDTERCHPASFNGYSFTPSTNTALYIIEIADFDNKWCGTFSCKDISSKTTKTFPNCVESPKSTAAIVGGAISGCLVLIIAIVLIWLGFRRYRCSKVKSSRPKTGRKTKKKE